MLQVIIGMNKIHAVFDATIIVEGGAFPVVIYHQI